MKKILCFALLAAMLATAAGAWAVTSLELPWSAREEDTVTITKEEYERLQQYEKLDVLMQLIDAYYYEDADHAKMLDGAAAGLLDGVGDIHTFYYTGEEWEDFQEKVTGEYAGIGCQLLADPEDELITVTRVFKGSPAEAVGVQAGDKIVYVNDVYYSAHEMNEAVGVMRGTPGESVKVTVLRGLKTLDFDIVRADIQINYVEYEILEDVNLGYVLVYDFMGDAVQGFADAVALFREKQVDGMIIDLRNNGGGLLDAAVQMADMILPEGTVVSTRDKYGYEERKTIDGEYYKVPMAVLINGYSASASEILAGAIRDDQAGTLIGTKSFGKGIVQVTLPLGYFLAEDDGSAMQVTTARYFTPSGECIHDVGIEPDIVAELDEDAVTRYGLNNLPHEHDAQLQRAIRFLTGQPEPEAAEATPSEAAAE